MNTSATVTLKKERWKKKKHFHVFVAMLIHITAFATDAACHSSESMMKWIREQKSKSWKRKISDSILVFKTVARVSIFVMSQFHELKTKEAQQNLLLFDSIAEMNDPRSPS